MTRPDPLGLPPAGMTDPYVRRLNRPWKDWKRDIRGWIAEPHHLAAALTLAGYANGDGSNAHPGTARLAGDLCRGERAVKATLAWLDEFGFITRTARGGRAGAARGNADTYQLTIPAPLATALGLWPDEHGLRWMERPADVPKRQWTKGSRTARDASADQGQSAAPTRGSARPTRGSAAPDQGQSDCPPPRTYTSPSSPFRSLESGVTSAKRRDDEERDDEEHDGEQERGNEEEPEDHDWISEQVGGLDAIEESTVDSMLAAGVNRWVIRNKINKDRNFVP